jgi:hypothetical protein
MVRGVPQQEDPMDRKTVIPALVVLLLVAAVVAYFQFFRDREQAGVTTEEPTGIEQEPVAEGRKIEPIDVELDKSDELVRRLAGGLSSRPELARWLLSEQLIRNFVAAVENIAAGHSPRAQIPFFTPNGPFAVTEEDGETFADPRSFRRYDLFADVFTSLDTEGTITLYRQLTPAISEAYKELGHADGRFHPTLERAIAELLRVPVVEERIWLDPQLITYKMVDPGLEGLSAAQKHLLRMGPDNVRSIQAKLREISQHPDFRAAMVGP